MQRVPVQLTGVVTAIPGATGDFFIQDQTAGISVTIAQTGHEHVGDRVQVKGVSDPGMFAPSVMASQILVLGRGRMPAARDWDYSDLAGGGQDSRWIEVHGVVHAARMIKVFGHDTLLIVLQVGLGRVRVLFQDFAGMDRSRLVDSTVRIRGVCATDFNEKRQFVGVALYVPERRDLQVLNPASVDPFAARTRPVRNVMQFGETAHRVKVAGIITDQISGQSLYLQDKTDGIKLQTTTTEVIPAGTRVEALGFPAAGDYAPILEDVLIRVVGTGVIVPQPILASHVFFLNRRFVQAPNDQHLVEIQGEVVESHIRGDQRVWILNEQGETYEAYLPLAASTAATEMLRSGSVVKLTGVCVVHADYDRFPDAFSILLRSAGDVVVLRRPPWWTPGHTLMVLAFLAGVTLLITLWVVILRNRVQGQTRVIRESEQRFRNLAEHDVLTGLPNRLMLDERIGHCLAHCRAENCKAAVFTIDIDRFKQINDSYGHHNADECLKAVAARLRSRVRKMDTIARTGGEEFTLVVGGLPNRESARRVAAAMLDLFLEPVVLPGHEIKVTISIGGAIYPDDGVETAILHKRSDQALYEAKRLGRNLAVFATEEMAASVELAISIEGALREGLRSDKFTLYYQPLFDGAGTIRRLEALLRTTDEHLGEVGLGKFIPVAEESGLIVPLGRWVLEQTCRQIAIWQQAGNFACSVAVNVSARQLAQKGYEAEVLNTLNKFQIDPSLLQLELTETTVMTDGDSVKETIAHLAAAGLSFAIDDFGTGFSSLSRLHELAIKALKIDRSFVQDLQQDKGTYSIIRAIIQMARSLGVQVVAEGVETPDQFHILRELGCDLYQGFLFARPAPPGQVLQTLAENGAYVLTEPFVLPPALLPALPD